MASNAQEFRKFAERPSFICGSDARTIMGDDGAALVCLWREKRGEVESEDLSGKSSSSSASRPRGSTGLPLLWFDALVIGVLVEDLQHGSG
jgi:hypothetical protein